MSFRDPPLSGLIFLKSLSEKYRKDIFVFFNSDTKLNSKEILKTHFKTLFSIKIIIPLYVFHNYGRFI